VSPRTKVWLLYAFPYVMGACAFSALFSRRGWSFVGLALFALVCFGLAWIARRLLLPRGGERHREILPVVLMGLFGGVGIATLIGAIVTLARGNHQAAVGLGFFGLLFSGVGYLGKWLLAKVKRGK
jgi:hypothetical protein